MLTEPAADTAWVTGKPEMSSRSRKGPARIVGGKDRIDYQSPLTEQRLLHDGNQIVMVVVAAVGLASGRTRHFSPSVIAELRAHRIGSGGGRRKGGRRRVFRSG